MLVHPHRRSEILPNQTLPRTQPAPPVNRVLQLSHIRLDRGQASQTTTPVKLGYHFGTPFPRQFRPNSSRARLARATKPTAIRTI
jgi:hypothetical protein